MGSSVILPPPGQPVEGPDPNFTRGATPNIVTFSFDKIGPPATVYIQRDDRLHVKILNGFPGAGVTVSARLLMPRGPVAGQPDTNTPEAIASALDVRGWINTIQNTFLPDATRTANEFDLALAEGYLLSVSVTKGAGATFTRGQCFATVGLQRGAAAGSRFMNLVSEYVALDLDVCWPGGTIKSPIEGPGFTHSIQQANPGAGADWTFTAATGQRLRISSFSAVLTASAAAGNRQAELIVDDGANIVWRTTAQANVTAGQVVTFSATGTNVPQGIITTDQELVIPPTLVLAPGWRIRTATTGIQAGDQWSAIWFNVEEWING